jgi:hypothetical protein
LVYDFKISDQLPGWYVELDEFRIRQVLLNLIDNAIKFTDEGFVKVCANILEEPYPTKNNRTSLKIEVIDSGIGIPKNDQARLFTAFVQKDDQDKRKYGGTGLGLAISKRMTEMMGGNIEIESIPGVGSTFSLTFRNIRKYSDADHVLATGKPKQKRSTLPLSKRIAKPPSKTAKGQKSHVIPKMTTASKERTDLATFLNAMYEKKWKDTSQTASFTSIKKFAEEIGKLGVQYNSENLLNFSNDLFEYTENFDIDNIHALLKKFPDIIKSL